MPTPFSPEFSSEFDALSAGAPPPSPPTQVANFGATSAFVVNPAIAELDVSDTVTPITTQYYLDFLTSEHKGKPKLEAMISIFGQWAEDRWNLMKKLYRKFDVDIATGAQLDAVGAWVGTSRELQQAIQGVYFSWDTAGVGWDEGFWQGPFDPDVGISRLPDDPYRTLIYATIAANHWDGTIPSAYAAWDVLFRGRLQLLIQDHGDMSMDLGVFFNTNTPLDPVIKALLVTGKLDMRPAGVRINSYFQNAVPSGPIFSWDTDPTATQDGWDAGSWSITLA